MLVASLLFLWMCMWDTRSSKAPLLKDKPLALLFCGVEDGIESFYGNKLEAEETVVLLDMSGGAPVIRRVSSLEKGGP